jgi:hypothetical protein
MPPSTKPSTRFVVHAVDLGRVATNPYTAHEMFRERYHGTANFMTPRIVCRGLASPNVAYEISTGMGLRGDRGEAPQLIWGLAFLAWNGKGIVTLPARATMTHTLEDARRLMKAVRRELKARPSAWSDWTAEAIEHASGEGQ